MQLRVVTDQPWDVPADVLVVPVAAEPAFDGPLGELDRRAGGELARLHAFGELKGTRFSTALASGGETRGGRLLAVGFGDPARSSTARRSSGSRPPPNAGSEAGPSRRLAVWLTPLAEAIDGGAAGGRRDGRARRRPGLVRPADDLPRGRRIGSRRSSMS